jgi:hypothetical protein
MSALDRVRAKFKMPVQAIAKTDKSPSVGSVGSSHRQIDYCDGQLTPVQESARREVLAQLTADPEVQRAFCNRFENGDLIVTLAVRDVGTCELLIPAERFNSGSLDDYAALLACLGTGRKGATG